MIAQPENPEDRFSHDEAHIISLVSISEVSGHWLAVVAEQFGLSCTGLETMNTCNGAHT